MFSGSSSHQFLSVLYVCVCACVVCALCMCVVCVCACVLCVFVHVWYVHVYLYNLYAAKHSLPVEKCPPCLEQLLSSVAMSESTRG